MINMKLALITGMDADMFRVIEKIKERALSMDIGIGEITPVQRMIDIPIAVRKMGERPDIDSILILADFPELKMEHEHKKGREDIHKALRCHDGLFERGRCG